MVFSPVWTEEPILSNIILSPVFSTSSLWRLNVFQPKAKLLLSKGFSSSFCFVIATFSVVFFRGLGTCIIKNYHPNCNLTDNFKASHWADWHKDIHTSHWEMSSVRTSHVPSKAFASHSCSKLSFPKCISAPQKGVTGDYGMPKGD